MLDHWSPDSIQDRTPDPPSLVGWEGQSLYGESLRERESERERERERERESEREREGGREGGTPREGGREREGERVMDRERENVCVCVQRLSLLSWPVGLARQIAVNEDSGPRLLSYSVYPPPLNVATFVPFRDSREGSLSRFS